MQDFYQKTHEKNIQSLSKLKVSNKITVRTHTFYRSCYVRDCSRPIVNLL